MGKRVLAAIISLGVGLFVFGLFGFHGGAEHIVEKATMLAGWTFH